MYSQLIITDNFKLINVILDKMLYKLLEDLLKRGWILRIFKSLVENLLLTNQSDCSKIKTVFRRRSLVAELQLPKLTVRVRFPSLAPKQKRPSLMVFFVLDFVGNRRAEEKQFGELFFLPQGRERKGDSVRSKAVSLESERRFPSPIHFVKKAPLWAFHFLFKAARIIS